MHACRDHHLEALTIIVLIKQLNPSPLRHTHTHTHTHMHTHKAENIVSILPMNTRVLWISFLQYCKAHLYIHVTGNTLLVADGVSAWMGSSPVATGTWIMKARGIWQSCHVSNKSYWTTKCLLQYINMCNVYFNECTLTMYFWVSSSTCSSFSFSKITAWYNSLISSNWDCAAEWVAVDVG